MGIMYHLKEQEQRVREAFKSYLAGNRSAVTYDGEGHFLFKMDLLQLKPQFVAECMVEGEIIESHWEYSYEAIKMVFYCNPGGVPDFHVVCIVNDQMVMAKTIYDRDETKYKADFKTRIRPAKMRKKKP